MFAKRRKWIPLYIDSAHVSSGFYSDSAVVGCEAVGLATEIEMRGLSHVTALVVGDSSCKRVRQFSVVELPELAEIRVGRDSFTLATIVEKTESKYEYLSRPPAEWITGIATISGCPKLQCVTMCGSSFIEFVSLSISNCESFSDLSIGDVGGVATTSTMQGRQPLRVSELNAL